MERWRNERWRKKGRDRRGKADGRSPPRFLWPQYCPFRRRLSPPVTSGPFQQATGLPSALCGRPSLGLHTSCSPWSAASPSPPGTFSCFSQHFLPHPKALFLRGTSKRPPQPWPQPARASQKKAGPSFPPEACVQPLPGSSHAGSPGPGHWWLRPALSPRLREAGLSLCPSRP